MVFVTGGTGLIGGHLLYELVAAGKRVRALKRERSNLQRVLRLFSYYSGNPRKLFEEIEWVSGDILDYFRMEEFLEGVDEVYHCAAVVAFNPEERSEMMTINVEGTRNLVNAALEKGVKKFCHVSSVAALGNAKNGQLVNETTNWVPAKKVSGYSESKFFSETEVWRGIEEGLDAVIVNPSIVLGPGNWNSGSSRFFKAVGEGLKFYTKGVTGFVDVRDVTRAMRWLMAEPHFNVCKNQRFLLNAENRSYKSLFSEIAGALGKTPPRFFASDFFLALAWRGAAIWGRIARKSPAITRETAANSNAVRKFDGDKIKRFLNFEYLPVSTSIFETAARFKQETEKPREGKTAPPSGKRHHA